MPMICPCTMGNSISNALNSLRNAKKLSGCGETQTASAVLLRREVVHINTIYHENPYQYKAVFRLESGEELELKTTEERYAGLTEGQTADLTWQGEELVCFG